jgi:hypothetical protein
MSLEMKRVIPQYIPVFYPHQGRQQQQRRNQEKE